MSLDPLLQSALEIQIHAFAAAAAFVLGVLQLSGQKGTVWHRRLGWLWVGAMATVAISSAFVNTTCTVGPFSAIHLLTLLAIVTLPAGVIAARSHRVRAHATIMIGLFAGGLLIAGGLSLTPGRTMHDVAFGTHSSHERCWPGRPGADK